jgi:hypothetical protein
MVMVNARTIPATVSEVSTANRAQSTLRQQHLVVLLNCDSELVLQGMATVKRLSPFWGLLTAFVVAMAIPTEP